MAVRRCGISECWGYHESSVNAQRLQIRQSFSCMTPSKGDGRGEHLFWIHTQRITHHLILDSYTVIDPPKGVGESIYSGFTHNPQHHDPVLTPTASR